MRTLTIPLFAVTLCALSHICSATAIEECSSYSQADLRTCLLKKAQESETLLRQEEARALDTLSKWDEDKKYVALSKERLRISSQTFVQYRNVQCAFDASLGGGAIANALETRRLACVVDLNRVQADLYKRSAGSIATR